MRRRRLRKEAAHLEITAFINLIVVLVPFLLSVAVFTRLSVLELKLPASAATPAAQPPKAGDLQLEIVVRPGFIEVGDRIGGLIERIARPGDGSELKTLAALMVQLKARFPDQAEATLLAEPDTPYDALVQVMDAVRASVSVQGPRIHRAALFLDIAIGDAPLHRPVAGAAR